LSIVIAMRANDLDRMGRRWRRITGADALSSLSNVGAMRADDIACIGFRHRKRRGYVRRNES
jgi:hypothetical protein